MIKVTLIISALIVGPTGPQEVPAQKYEQKNLATCLESAKSFLVEAEEKIASSTSPLLGSYAICVLEYTKVEGQNIQR